MLQPMKTEGLHWQQARTKMHNIKQSDRPIKNKITANINKISRENTENK